MEKNDKVCKNFHAFSKTCYFHSTVWAVGTGKYLKVKVTLTLKNDYSPGPRL